MVAMEFAKKQGLSAQMQSKLLVLLQSEMAKLRESQFSEQAQEEARAAAQKVSLSLSLLLALSILLCCYLYLTIVPPFPPLYPSGQANVDETGIGADDRRSLQKRDRSVLDESLAEQLKAHANRIARDFQPSAEDGVPSEEEEGEEGGEEEEEEGGSEEDSDSDEYDESDSEEETDDDEAGDQEQYV